MYKEIKKVRLINGGQFISDFHAVGTIVAFTGATGRSFTCLKNDVWELAKVSVIYYTMTTEVFKNGRVVMQIL